jgi:hypothetical protein
MNWVLEDAPDLPPHCFGVLMALASKAREDGTAAYPGQEWLAERARKSDRSVRNDLAALEKAGLIRRGDQAVVSHLPADERPVVWDLAVERVRDRKHTSARKHTSGPKSDAQNAKVSDQQEPRKARKPTTARKPASARKSTSATDRKSASAYTSPHTSTTQHPSDAAAAGPGHTQDTLDGGPPPASPLTVNQRAKRITDAYANAVPMCKWQAVNAIVIRAINAKKWPDDEIRDAMLRLAESRRTVTVNSLGNELQPPEDNVHQFPQNRDSRYAPGSGSQVPPRGSYSKENYI